MVIAYTLKVILDSWIVGHVSTLLLRRLLIVDKRWQLNLVGNEELNRVLGVGIMKWFLVNSFIRHFNRRLQIPGSKPRSEQLTKLRDAMTHAELAHLIAFSYVAVRIGMNVESHAPPGVIISLIAMNIIMNLHPVLLQQMNKRRIDRVLILLRRRAEAISAVEVPR